MSFAIERIGRRYRVTYQYYPSCKVITIAEGVATHEAAVRLGVQFVPPPEAEEAATLRITAKVQNVRCKPKRTAVAKPASK